MRIPTVIHPTQFHRVCATLPFCERVVCASRAKYLPSKNRGIPVPKEPNTIGGHPRRRRLQLGISQSEAASRPGVSTVTLSRWECDKVYPAWAQQPSVIAHLGGYDPFTNPALGRPGGNETKDVVFLSPQQPANIGEMIMQYAIKITRADCRRVGA
jgi:transcriptional regulator with XRE-family HTH domain